MVSTESDGCAISLWAQWLTPLLPSQRQKAFDQLGETDYCSILAYLAYGLKKNVIAWLETGLEKYLFLHRIPVPYPRDVGCDCSYNDHLMAIMWECYEQAVKPLEENYVYNFTSLPRVLNNIYARPPRFGYYEIADSVVYGFPAVKFYVSREDITLEYSHGLLPGKYYPSRNHVTYTSIDCRHEYPGELEDPMSPEFVGR